MSTRNRAELLPKAVDSIIAQTLTDWELIVVDDCSEDNTSEVMAKYVHQDKRISYRKNKERLGSGKSKNPVMLTSKGKYIAVLDDDDWWEPTYLTKLVKAIKTNPNCPLAYSDIMRVDGNGRTYYWDCSKGKPFPNILPSATLLRGSTFRNLGGWDMVNFGKGYHAEADYYIRAGGSKNFIHVSEPLVHALISPDAMSYNSKANIDGLKAILRKHNLSRKDRSLYHLRIALHSMEGNLGNRRYFLKSLVTYPLIPEAWGGLLLCPSRTLFLSVYSIYRRITGYPPKENR